MTTDVIVEKKQTTKKALKEPEKYKVVVCNDDVTPIDFVIAMLMSVFKHGQEASLDLTMKIHKQGSAVVGIYSYEIAEQKSIDGINMARANGFPLIIKVESE